MMCVHLMGQTCLLGHRKFAVLTFKEGSNGHLYHVTLNLHLPHPSGALMSKRLVKVLPHVSLTGYCIARPEVIIKLEQGEKSCGH